VICKLERGSARASGLRLHGAVRGAGQLDHPRGAVTASRVCNWCHRVTTRSLHACTAAG